jgi:hypothetical protein
MMETKERIDRRRYRSCWQDIQGYQAWDKVGVLEDEQRTKQVLT